MSGFSPAKARQGQWRLWGLRRCCRAVFFRHGVADLPEIFGGIFGGIYTTISVEGVMNFAADKARCRDENPQALSERC
ncbi:hypothetical protein, partial [Burkholderia ubonensis]|uniref:hypothetical protein n=1 Tax=Burkholderia ubonensis TaxID=101571 RepID=UPI001E3735AE